MNQAPVAVMDMETVNRGGVIVINVLMNDTDADGALDPLTVEIVPATGPMNGIAVVNPDGTIGYTHDGGGSTSDAFVYTVRDDDGAISNQAMVAIDVLNDSLPAASGNDATITSSNFLNGALASASMFNGAGAVEMVSGGGDTGTASVIHAGDTVIVTGTAGDEVFRFSRDDLLRITVGERVTSSTRPRSPWSLSTAVVVGILRTLLVRPLTNTPNSTARWPCLSDQTSPSTCVTRRRFASTETADGTTC